MKMTLPDDWENIDPAEDGRPKPPADAYICRIVDVSVSNDRLRLNLDIASGDYAGFFAEDFAIRSARNPQVYWGLQHSVPINFADPARGHFYKRLFKRFVNTLEQTNQNFHVPRDYDTDMFKEKKLVAQVYIVEKPGPEDRVYQNYRVAKEFSMKALAEGKVPESWIEDENGNRRKPNEPRPTPEPRNDDLEPVDDVDIPF